MAVVHKLFTLFWLMAAFKQALSSGLADPDAPSFDDICSGCTYGVTGVGYVPDKTDCSQYYVCVASTNRYYLRSCAPGLHFDSTTLRCNWPSIANCAEDPPVDPCRHRRPKAGSTTSFLQESDSGSVVVVHCGSLEIYSTTSCECESVDPCDIRRTNGANTTSYLQLGYGNAWVELNCEAWNRYNAVTCQCEADPCYGKSAFPLLDTVYIQEVHGQEILMPCAPATAYNDTTCNCDIHTSHIPTFCGPKLFLPLLFYYHNYPCGRAVCDLSGNDLYVDSNGIGYNGAFANFDGTKSLTIPYFSNGFYGSTLVISMYVKRADNGLNIERTILSNALCPNKQPSVFVYNKYDYICFKLRNEEDVEVEHCQLCENLNEWMYVSLVYKDGLVTFNAVPVGQTPSAPFTEPFSGTIASTGCPLGVGNGNTQLPYYGSIAKLIVFTDCCPDVFMSPSVFSYLASTAPGLVSAETIPDLIAAADTGGTADADPEP